MVKCSVLLLSGDKRQSFLKLVSSVMLMKCPYLRQTRPPWNQVGFKPTRFPRRQTGNVSHSAVFCCRKKRNKGRKEAVVSELVSVDTHLDTEVSPVKSDLFYPSSSNSSHIKAVRAIWPLSHFTFTTCSQLQILQIQQKSKPLVSVWGTRSK